jgi:putative peptide zinc metalloprotease protein
VSPLAEISRVNGSDRYLLRIGNRSLYISEIIAVIVRSLQKGDKPSVILKYVNQHRFPLGTISQEQLDCIILENIIPLELTREESAVFTTPIKFRKVLLRRLHFEKMLCVFRPVYSVIVFYLTFSILFAMTVWWSSTHDHLAVRLPIFGYLMLPLCILVIGLLHELGHAGAADRFGVKFKEIGVGIYLIFPAFYVDVTDVWRLRKRERVVVNLAGMHVQLFLNSIIIVLCVAIGDGLWFDFLNNLIWVNTTLVLINLNLFLKFDGYWVFSDAFNIPNLRLASETFIKNIWANPSSLRGEAWSPLLWYSIGSVIFFSFGISVLLIWISHTFFTKPQLLREIFQTGELWSAVYPTLHLVFAVFAVVVIFRKLNQILKNNFKRSFARMK